jgi:hypothetical protein
VTTRPGSRRPAVALSVLLILIGVVLLVQTALVGGGIGYLIGALFVLGGALRLRLMRA